jgi:hypothetical protein
MKQYNKFFEVTCLYTLRVQVAKEPVHHTSSVTLKSCLDLYDIYLKGNFMVRARQCENYLRKDLIKQVDEGSVTADQFQEIFEIKALLA